MHNGARSTDSKQCTASSQTRTPCIQTQMSLPGSSPLQGYHNSCHPNSAGTRVATPKAPHIPTITVASVRKWECNPIAIAIATYNGHTTHKHEIAFIQSAPNNEYNFSNWSATMCMPRGVKNLIQCLPETMSRYGIYSHPRARKVTPCRPGYTHMQCMPGK